MGDARLAFGGDRPGERTPHQHVVRSECNRLDDVTATPETAVNEKCQ